jgi:predicted RNA-binding protein with RPS1 domain
MNEKVGDILEGVVVRVYPHYAILLFPSGSTGLLHISELSKNFVHNFTSIVSVGNIYRVKVIAVDLEKDSMHVSIKALSEIEKRKNFAKRMVNPSKISFVGLENHLDEWIKDENAQRAEEKR